MATIITSTSKEQKPTRREHIVPRLLLAQFADPKGVLWVYEKSKPARPSVPANECIERDFYEYELSGRKTNNKYENWLARVESDASKILHLLVNRESLGQSDAVNLQAVQFGHRNVYANVNSPDIQSLVDTEINQIVFGQNAFLPGAES